MMALSLTMKKYGWPQYAGVVGICMVLASHGINVLTTEYWIIVLIYAIVVGYYRYDNA